jgi:excisionase family DNA binding protein
MISSGRSEPPKFFSIAYVAEALSVSVRTVRRWIDRGELKIGGRVVYRLSDIEAFESAKVHTNTIGPVDQGIEAEPVDGNR